MSGTSVVFVNKHYVIVPGSSISFIEQIENLKSILISFGTISISDTSKRKTQTELNLSGNGNLFLRVSAVVTATVTRC